MSFSGDCVNLELFDLWTCFEVVAALRDDLAIGSVFDRFFRICFPLVLDEGVSSGDLESAILASAGS